MIEPTILEQKLQPSVSVELPPSLQPLQAPADEIAMEERLDFAKLALQHVQELNARADSKAYLVLTADGFLIAFLGWMASAVTHVWQSPFSFWVALQMGSTIALTLTVANSLSHAFKVMAPRLKQAANTTHGDEHGPHVHPASLLFFVDIVQAHHTDKDYASALLHASPEELIANLASSIYGSSISAQEKYKEANASIRALGPVLVAWVIFVGLTFALG